MMGMQRSRRRQPKARAMAPPVSEALEVMVQRIGDIGDGIAETPTGRLYIPFTAAGDRARVRPGRARGDGRAATLDELLSPGPERTVPPCPHFGRCGGCALQHLTDEAYVAWKIGRLVHALARVGIEDHVTAPPARTPPGSRRRATFAAARPIAGRAAIAGFNIRESNDVVDLARCVVLDARIVDLLPGLRDLLTVLLPVRGRAAVTVTLLDGGLDVVLTIPLEPDLRTRERLAAFAASADVARLSWRDSGETTAETVVQRRPVGAVFGGVFVPLPPGAFMQASAEGERALVDAVRDAVGPARSVADLFAGAGTFSFPLAIAGARVRAVDADEASLAALATAARAHAPLAQRIVHERRDLFARPLVASELKGCDAVVFDPPRAGAAAQATELARSSVRVIAAVSCNPATFARDARILADGGYTLERVLPVDQFLWSPHLELVATFRRL